MKNLNVNEIEVVSGGCEGSRYFCIPLTDYPTVFEPAERPEFEPIVWQDPYQAPVAPFSQ